MTLPSDHDRQIANIVRFGEITDVDMSTKPPMVRVSIDNDVKSDWMPYAQACIGDFYIWSPPTVGTHGIMISENGDNEVCRFIPSFNNEGNTPALTGEDFEIHLKNGDVITHNSETGDMTINITGNLTMNADKDITLNSKQNIALNAEAQLIGFGQNYAIIESNSTAVLKSPQNFSDAPITYFAGGIGQGTPPPPTSTRLKRAIDYSINLIGKMFTKDIETEGGIHATDTIKSDRQVKARNVDLEDHKHKGVTKGNDLSELPEKADI